MTGMTDMIDISEAREETVGTALTVGVLQEIDMIGIGMTETVDMIEIGQWAIKEGTIGTLIIEEEVGMICK